MRLFDDIKRYFKPRKSEVEIFFSERDNIDRVVDRINNSKRFKYPIITSVSVSRADSTGQPTYVIAISYTYIEQ